MIQNQYTLLLKGIHGNDNKELMISYYNQDNITSESKETADCKIS